MQFRRSVDHAAGLLCQPCTRAVPTRHGDATVGLEHAHAGVAVARAVAGNAIGVGERQGHARSLDQRRQGYTSDGILGPTTVARLRRPFPERIRQIALSLERWRWLPPTFSEPPVIVNVPAFRLCAFSSSSDRESDVLTMDVVVGDACDSRTPVFSDQIEYAVFSPYWNVPPSISRQELLPKARRDPGYLARGNYEVVSNAGTVLGTSASALSAVAGGR